MVRKKWAYQKMVVFLWLFLISCKNDYCELDFSDTEIEKMIENGSSIIDNLSHYEFKGTFGTDEDSIKLYWHEGVLPMEKIKGQIHNNFLTVTYYPKYSYFALESGWNGESCGLLALKNGEDLPLLTEIIRKLEDKNEFSWFLVSKK